MTEPHLAPTTTAVSHALQQALHRYLEGRKQDMATRWTEIVHIQNCRRIQQRHFLKDLVLNPINTLWAIPYLTVRKFIEGAEKIGIDLPDNLISMIPKSFKTGFQAEMEREIQTKVFGLPGPESDSALEKEIESDPLLTSAIPRYERQLLIDDAETDIRKAVADFCGVHNGFTDLAASLGVVWVARKFFHDGSLDVFGIGKKMAAGWAREDAVSGFFLGRSAGNFYYDLAGAPKPSSKQMFLGTAISMFLLALFSTLVNVMSYPVQSQLGFKRKQIDRLLRNVEDRVLLRFTKASRKYDAKPGAIPTGATAPAAPETPALA